ncbi:MAG TPA: hypothetical protein VLQ91_04400 [Draconibacterium sp.]|nr:hypothetical protein [Draconibacterium sp.]
MKINELFLTAVFSVLTVCFLSAEPTSAQSKSPKQENLMVGEWFPLNTSNGGLGAGYTFNEDGKFTTILGAYVAFKYKLEGDTLIMILPGAGENKTKVEITSTKLIFINNERNTELTRIAGDNNTGIIGKWSGVHDTGSKQIIDFTAFKDMYLSVPMSSEPGTYEIKGDIVELFGKN